MATLDQDGNIVADASPNLGAADQYSFGSAIWEFFHPGQVQQEQIAVGQTPSSYTDIWGGAFDQAAQAGAETVQNVGTGISNVASATFDFSKLLILGVIAVAVLDVLHHEGKGVARVRSKAEHHVRRMRKHLKRR